MPSAKENLFSACAFARPVPIVPASLIAKLASMESLNDEEDETYTRSCGVLPGFPEVFLSEEARDAALGPFGPYVRFVPASWVEAEAGGFEVASVAIGHPLGDPSFAGVAPMIMDAVATRLRDDDSHDVVIHRTRYVIRRLTTGAVKTYGWMTEFDGTDIDVKDALATVAYLDRELNDRI